MKSGPLVENEAISSPGQSGLSLPQRRLWVLERLHPRNPAHNASYALRLSGPLDVEKLGRAWREVVQQYEVLRTEFHVVEGVPQPVVVATFSQPLRAVDLEG